MTDQSELRRFKTISSPSSTKAKCVLCHEFKPVCCNQGLRGSGSGQWLHTEPLCQQCCPTHQEVTSE